MIVERSMHPEWLSNAYLVADEPGGSAVIIDSGGPSETLLEAIERKGVAPRYLLLTHHHGDHVAENHVYKERFGVEILAHPLEAENLMDVDRTIEPGQILEVGRLRIDSLLTPGHTAGMLAFVVNDEGMALFFALLYRYLPSTRVRWRSVWVGAAAAALLYLVGNYAVSFYLGYTFLTSAAGLPQ